MTFEEFKNYCLSKKGVEETYPFGDMAAWFKIGGKAFCWTFVEMFIMGEEMKPAFTFVNCKCDPDKAIEWQEQYSAVQPGWHQSKKHWNSVFMDGSIPGDDFRAMIDHAYDIVVASLSKKAQIELGL
ncbi:MAG: putative DNA-binding protein (MmcQ/YjbR family) [Saprospiraceae bacterium]|jgi:predicted DNA-binding protein (MmcQ/YjbR family)